VLGQDALVFSLHLQACFARNAAAETASEKKKEKEEEEIIFHFQNSSNLWTKLIKESHERLVQR